MREQPFAGRVALVTGAGRGIGQLIASWLADAGAHVAVCARTPAGITSFADDQRARGRRVHAEVCDVTDHSALGDLVRRVSTEFGGIDIAVANAAVLGPVGTIGQTDPREWDRALAVNVGGTAAVVRAVVESMAERGYGRIITLSGGGVGGPNLPARLSAYVASKAGVMLLTEVLAAEMPDGVTINSVAPGAVPTGFMDRVLAVGPEVAGADLFESVRGTSMPDLEGLRELVLYVASEDGAWLNGRCLSARWDPPGELRALEKDGVAPSRFRLRRIDEDLFSDRNASWT